jgi:hypothetical protein
MQIVCIPAYTKMTNLDKSVHFRTNLNIFELFTVHYPDLEICYSYTAHNMENFALDFCMKVEAIIIYI